MAMHSLLMLIFMVSQTCGLKTISDHDYSRMPPLLEVDPYHHCLMQDGGVYCVAHADLYSDQPSELMTMIQDFSASRAHFNHSRIKRGYCVTRRCKQFYKGNSSSELEETMQACLDDHMTQEYQLRAIATKIYCYQRDDEQPLETLDLVVAAVFLGIVGLSVLGTVYHLYYATDDKSLLICFSLKANWDQLMKDQPSDPRLAGINGVRILSSLIIITTHILGAVITYVENTNHVEEILEQRSFVHLFLNVFVGIQTYFFMSGMFLVLSLQKAAKKGFQVTWKMVPKVIFIRWLRLIPLSMVPLFFSMTWFRFLDRGLYFEEVVMEEVQGCRRSWLVYILGFINYVEKGDCLITTWSVACELQLFSVGLAVVALCPNKKTRNRVLWGLFVVGLLTPVIETFRFNMQGALFITANHMHYPSEFVDQPTFAKLHKPTHTNLVGLVMGMAFGYKLFDGLEKGIPDAVIKKYQKYTVLYWCLLPLLSIVVLWSTVFPSTDPASSTPAMRAAVALLRGPAYIFVLAVLIAGSVFGVERPPILRNVFGWRAWGPLATLSYGALVVHVTLLRVMLAPQATLRHFSRPEMVRVIITVVMESYAVALVLYLLVEAPIRNLTHALFAPKRPTQIQAPTQTQTQAPTQKEIQASTETRTPTEQEHHKQQ